VEVNDKIERKSVFFTQKEKVLHRNTIFSYIRIEYVFFYNV